MQDFFTAARAFCGTALDASALPLAHRIEALGDALAVVVLTGRVLPPVAAPAAPPPPGPAADGWPGLGSVEQVWRSHPLKPDPPELVQLSDLLLSVERWLWAGLEAWARDDPDAAAGWWAGGWPVWGTDAIDALAALHHAGLRFREVPRTRGHAAPPEVVALVTPGPEPALVDGPVDAVPGVLGVRFESVGVGALVREIHPASPAAEVLQPGDVLLSAGPRTLEDLGPDVMKQVLAVPVGQRVRCEVYRDGEMLQVDLQGIDPDTLI